MQLTTVEIKDKNGEWHKVFSTLMFGESADLKARLMSEGKEVRIMAKTA
jgi:hypothetical protein